MYLLLHLNIRLVVIVILFILLWHRIRSLLLLELLIGLCEVNLLATSATTALDDVVEVNLFQVVFFFRLSFIFCRDMY